MAVLELAPIEPLPQYDPEWLNAQSLTSAEADRKVLQENYLNNEPSLGQLNPLINYPDLHQSETTQALALIINKKIAEFGGEQPISVESSLVLTTRKAEKRFIARFEVSDISPEQMELLEKLVAWTYAGQAVRTRKNVDGVGLSPEPYPPLNINDSVSITGGWYMGPNLTPTESLHTGLFVFRDLGNITNDNFFDKSSENTRYIVEVREEQMYQTDLVAFIAQVSSILKRNKLLPHGELLYQVYYDLIKLDLRSGGEHLLHGMEEARDLLMRRLILPLGNLDFINGTGQRPESALLVGVPGTGKTLLVEQLLREDPGILIVPIDTATIMNDLSNPYGQVILQRVARVASLTGKSVVLHIDDIEGIVDANRDNSLMLNLMAGIRKTGFFVIASTNVPEAIDPALIQPERFGIVIHCGLQDEESRLAVLNIHANKESRQLHKFLFVSDKEREAILTAIARRTNYFTPRYLAEIVSVAKSYLLAHVVSATGRRTGLTEEDLEGHVLSIQDWAKAFMEVASRYKLEEVKQRDEELKQFVEKSHTKPIGFLSTTNQDDSLMEEINQILERD